MEKVTSASILVVGGTGFIGHHVVRRAIDSGWRATSIGLNPPSPTRMVTGADYVALDMTNPGALSRLGVLNFDYVVNLGGYVDHMPIEAGGGRVIRAHFDALVTLIESLDRKRLRRFVQIGSSDEYGNAAAPQCENLRESPISPYSAAKVAATPLIQLPHQSEDFPGIVLRPFLTYGPGQDQRRFLPQLIQGCLDRRVFPVSEGAQLRDFCYVHDTVDAIFRSLECDNACGQIFNIASGEPRSIRSVIDSVVSLVGSGTPKFGAIAYRRGESMALYADVTLARTVLGWEAKTPFLEGVAETIAWMKSCPP